jgi:hypothetical protein
MPNQMAASIGPVVDGTGRAATEGSGEGANSYRQYRQVRAATPTASAHCGQTFVPPSVLSSSVILPALPSED